jgi:hypothetical protein
VKGRCFCCYYWREWRWTWDSRKPSLEYDKSKLFALYSELQYTTSSVGITTRGRSFIGDVLYYSLDDKFI